MQNGNDSLLAYVASTVVNQVIVSTDTHVAVFSPVLTPAIFNQPVFFAVHVQSILTEAHNSHCMVGALIATTTLVLEISDYPITVVLYAIIDVEVCADCSLTSKTF